VEQEFFSPNVQAVSGVKRSGLDVDHPPPPSAEFKNKWSYISTSAVTRHGVHKDKFALLSVLGYSY
jgi:hypothetical protein